MVHFVAAQLAPLQHAATSTSTIDCACSINLTNTHPWMQGMAGRGTLAKLTVNDLKKYCEANHLLKSGKKDDIVQRVKEHLEKT